MGDKKVKSHRKLIWSAFSALAFAIIMTSVIGTSFFDDLTTQVVGKKRGVNYMDPNDPKYRGVSYCKDSKNDAYGPICQKCYDSNGAELFEECWGTTDDDGDRGGSGGAGYWEDGVWHDEGDRQGGNEGDDYRNQYGYANYDPASCKESKDGDNTCKTCNDHDGNYSFKECWDRSGTIYFYDDTRDSDSENDMTQYEYDDDGGRADEDDRWDEGAKQCEYYEQSQDGGGCKDCYQDGKYVGGECWNKNAQITRHDKEGSIEGRYEKKDEKKKDEKKDERKDEKKKEEKKEERKEEKKEERKEERKDERKDERKEEKKDERKEEKKDDGDRQDWIDEGGYCVRESRGSCEVCYDSEGNFGGKYCPETGTDKRDEDKREDDKRGDDERGDDERGDDERGDDERGDDERNFDKADAKEVEKSLKDMRKNLKNFDKKEWKQLTKRLDRIEKNYNKFLERLDKMAEKDDVDLGDLKEKVDELKEALEAISKEADSQQSAMDNLVSKVQREIDAVDSRSITWDELNQLWTEVRKVDVYWMIRDGLDMRVNAEERYENLLEMEKEISRMRAQMEVDDAVSEKLDDILKFIEDFDSNRTNALEAYEEILDMAEEVQNFSGDMRDMDDAMRDMWDQMDTLREGFQDMNDELQDFMEDSWETIDEGWNSGHDKMFYEDMKREIENISETLKLVVELKELLADNENERVKTAVTKLAELAEKAKSTLDGLKKRLEDDELDPEVFESAWDVLERIGQSAESSMEVLHKYYKDLPKDAQEIVDMLEKDDGGPRGGGKDKFRDVYGGLEGQDIDIDNIVRQIKDEVLDQVMRAVSQELMKELAPYLGEKVVAEILNNIGALGKDGEKLLASSTEVYGRIAEVDDGNMSEKLRELAKRTEKTLIVASLKDSFKEKWAEVATAAEAGDKERMKSLESEIEALLADNFEKSTTGEEAYQYRDVLAGEGLWYYSYVLGATKDGDVSGFRDKNGRATGEFKPENNVTQGEALKMVLNSCGVDVVSAPPPQPWMPTDHWAVKEGYLPMAVKLGIDQFIDLKNPNKTATREDVAVMFAEACSLDTSEDQTAFSDYNGRFGGHVQAVYNAKIFTGQGDTGNFDGAKNINRAAMTKAMEVAKGSVRAGSVIDDLDAFEDVLGGSKKAFPSPTPNDEE